MQNRLHNSTKLIVAAALMVGTILSTGCATNLQNNLRDPAIWARVAEISERTQRRMQQPAPRAQRTYSQPQRQAPQFHVAGHWSHSPKTVYGFNTIYTTTKTNVISQANGGIYAKAKGGKTRYFYEYVGNNTYRSAQGQTYTFTSANKAVWRGPGSKSITLTRKR